MHTVYTQAKCATRVGTRRKNITRVGTTGREGEIESMGDFKRNRGGYFSSTHYSRYRAEAEVYGADGYSP